MDVHVLNVLETVSQVANEWMVDMLEHATLSNDVSNALGSYNCLSVSPGPLLECEARICLDKRLCKTVDSVSPRTGFAYLHLCGCT